MWYDWPMESNLRLDMKKVALDLTKATVVTILALILQFSLAAYLNHGGWPIVYSMLEKYSVIEK